jgi:hypothetical protein
MSKREVDQTCLPFLRAFTVLNLQYICWQHLFLTPKNWPLCKAFNVNRKFLLKADLAISVPLKNDSEKPDFPQQEIKGGRSAKIYVSVTSTIMLDL